MNLPLSLVAGDADPDPGRLYWARYENAYGKIWETVNPGERSARLNITGVRLVRLREWRDDRRRLRAPGHGRSRARRSRGDAFSASAARPRASPRAGPGAPAPGPSLCVGKLRSQARDWRDEQRSGRCAQRPCLPHELRDLLAPVDLLQPTGERQSHQERAGAASVYSGDGSVVTSRAGATMRSG